MSYAQKSMAHQVQNGTSCVTIGAKLISYIYTPHMLILIFYAEGDRNFLFIGISKGPSCFLCTRTLPPWPLPNPFHPGPAWFERMEIPDVAVVYKIVKLKALFHRPVRLLIGVGGAPDSSHHTFIHSDAGGEDPIALWTCTRLVQNYIHFTVP